MADTITIKSKCTVCGKRYMQTRHPMFGVPGPCPECKDGEKARRQHLCRLNSGQYAALARMVVQAQYCHT